MKIKHLFALCFFSIQILTAQEATTEVIKPLLLDKSVLSGVGLRKIDLKDEPEKDFYQKRLYRGDDISVYIVSTESWANTFDEFGFDEFVYMYHGEAIVKPKGGQAQLFHTGDYFFAAKGFSGQWEIRAGDHLHYELSIITTSRADTSLVSEDLNHFLFSPSKISGTAIHLDQNGYFEETLKKGIELTIKLVGEKPAQKTITNPEKEKLVQLLSGQITLTDSSGEQQVFYAKDFFVIPKGFTGEWKNEGHGLVKYLTVEKTEH